MKLSRALTKYKDHLSKNSRTAQSWIQYIYYINIVKQFIRVERTGNWRNHLTVVGQMINLFAAPSNFRYAESARLYLQLMDELPVDYPWLYNLFQLRYYTIRRSDRFWAGLWTGLAIEQSLMRTVKSRGGLTRARGMTESVLLLWVLSGHKCAEIHKALT